MNVDKYLWKTDDIIIEKKEKIDESTTTRKTK